MNISLRVRMLYTALLLKLYKYTKNIFPMISNTLGRYIENKALINSKEIHDIISKEK